MYKRVYQTKVTKKGYRMNRKANPISFLHYRTDDFVFNPEVIVVCSITLCLATR